jgi:hypothetical protein
MASILCYKVEVVIGALEISEPMSKGVGFNVDRTELDPLDSR